MAERIAVVLGALAMLALPWFGPPDLVSLGTQAIVLALAAASLDLLIGYGGLVSFGHAAFFGLGGYTVAILATEGIATSAATVWPAAIAVAALAALVIGALSLRTSGLQFIMITLAFAEMLFFFFVSWKTYGGDDGLGFRRRSAIPGIDPRDDVAFYYVCLALLAAFLALCGIILRARFGMALQGLRQNARRLQAIGVAPYRYRLACFVLGGAGAGLAGALQANLLRFVSPDMLHWTTSGELMVMVVLGGTGSLFGPVLGAWAYTLMESYLGQWTEHWMLALGPVLILVVLFAPKGLWGLISKKTG
jgi:branched-chain amino acid transport system permease protein